MKISIISITLNNLTGLKKTLESVVKQTYKDIEYIVIDGGSTDGSKEYLQENDEHIAYWCSEPDNGIYNAFNKSLPHITGDYCLFLNAGDYLNDESVIEKVVPYLNGEEIVYGNENKEKKGKITLSKYPETLDDNWFKRTALCHQSTFIRADVQKSHPYSEEWQLLGDWMLFRNLIVCERVKYKHIPVTVSVYNLEGISSTNRDLHNREKVEFYKKIGRKL